MVSAFPTGVALLASFFLVDEQGARCALTNRATSFEDAVITCARLGWQAELRDERGTLLGTVAEDGTWSESLLAPAR
jgi:hypothetical protein